MLCLGPGEWQVMPPLPFSPLFLMLPPAALWPVGQRQAWPQRWLKRKTSGSKHLRHAAHCVPCCDTVSVKPSSPRTGGGTSKTHGLLSAHTLVLLACHKLAMNLAPLRASTTSSVPSGVPAAFKFAKDHEEVFYRGGNLKSQLTLTTVFNLTSN